jgi:hypothetical protein
VSLLPVHFHMGRDELHMVNYVSHRV